MYEIAEVAARQHTYISIVFDERTRRRGRSEEGHQREVGSGNSDKGGEIPKKEGEIAKGGDGSLRQEARTYGGPFIPWMDSDELIYWERSFHFFEDLDRTFL